jgi:hypothetical protein
MKCIIGVISSPGSGYDDMKDIWIENVNEFNKRSEKDKVYLFFLESHERNDTTQYAIEQISENHIYKFKPNCEEKFENLLKKTLIFFQYIKEFHNEKVDDEYTFVIRSNLSTLFNLDRVFKLFKEINNKMTESKSDVFIGGSVIDNYYGIGTCYSGTNITMSLPIVKIVASNAGQVMETAKEDDIALSRWTILNNIGNLLSQDIMRVDFIEDMVLLNSTDNIEDEKIFCYRFKTKNRENDSKLMKKLLEKIYDKEFKLVDFILENKGERKVYGHNSHHAKTIAKECFKFV